MGHNSISRRLTRQFILLAIGPLLLISLIVPFSVYQSQKTQSLSRQFQIAANIGVQVQTYLHELEYVLNRTGLELAKTATQAKGQDEIIAELLSYNNAFQSIALLSPAGQEVRAVHYFRSLSEKDLQSRASAPAFIEALKTHKISMGPVRYDSDNREPVVRVVLPIVDVQSGTVSVMISAELRLKQIWDTVADMSLSNEVVAYILDKSGNVIAHSDQSVVLKETQISLETAEGVVQGLNGELTVRAFDSFNFANQRFSVYVEKNAYDALDVAIKVTALVALFIVGAAVIAVFLIYWARREIIHPLDQLKEIVRAIIRGESEKRARVYQDDEIGELAQSFNEMTDRNQSLMEEMRQAEKKYRAIFENAAEGLFQSSLQGRFLNANPALIRMLGYDDLEDLLGSINDISADVHVFGDQRKSMIARLVDGGKLVCEEILCNRKDGLQIWIRATMQAVRDLDGRILYLEGSAEDVTHQKKMDALLKQSNEEERIQSHLLRHSLQSASLDTYAEEALEIVLEKASLFGAMDVGAVFLNAEPEEGRQLRLVAQKNFPIALNTSCSKVAYGVCLCGRAAQEGETLFSFGGEERLELSPEEFLEYGHYSSPILAEGETIGVLLLLFEKGHGPTPSQAHFIARLTDILGMGLRRRLDEIAIKRINESLEERVRERTEELKEMNKALKTEARRADEANRAKSTFLSQMSHELRTPLNGILGFAQLIQIGVQKGNMDRVEEFSDQILSAGKHLLQLINEILDLARIEAGQMSMSIEEIDLLKVIDEVFDLTGQLGVSCDIELHKEVVCTGPVPGISADYVRIKQVLMNLVSNAIKYNRKNGSVTIRLDCPKADQVRISVVDTGIGIAPEAFDQLFIPFDRLNADSMDIEGTGIGLSITQKLVGLLNGELHVESELGVGSTFAITFPALVTDNALSLPAENKRVGKEKPYQQTSLSDAETGATARVLYIEDNPANLALMENIFANHMPYELLSASTGKKGIESAQENQPDLILLDIHLPDLNGYEVFKVLQKFDETRVIPVVAVSANAMPGDVEKGMALGFREYLTKPLDIARTIACVEHYLTRKSAE